MNDQEKIQVIRNWLGSGAINIFGLPFAGKDTQCDLLARALNGSSIGGGEIMRDHPDQEVAREVMASGGIVPTDVFFQLILPYFSKDEFKGKPLILSSVGRSHGEEPVIMEAAQQSGHPVKAVFFLDMDEEEVWKRHKAAQFDKDRGSRADDSGDDVLRTRLENFRNNTMKVIDYYRECSLLTKIDGAASREEVMSSIIDTLYQSALQKTS